MLAPDKPVQAAPELVGQERGDSQVGVGLRIGHASRVTASIPGGTDH
jgi:hypothetical protein